MKTVTIIMDPKRITRYGEVILQPDGSGVKEINNWHTIGSLDTKQPAVEVKTTGF